MCYRGLIPFCFNVGEFDRFLATGDSFRTIACSFRIGRSTVSGIVPEMCRCLWNNLNEVYMKAPSTIQCWTDIAQRFEERWNFPNCLGAIDGKHVVIKCPVNSGSLYYNYKGTYSIILMAVADAE